jgi:nucleotide-sensitive chloride channel 1A
MSASGKGFQIPYPAITLHAISRTEGGPSIYCQLDDNFATQSADDGAEEDEAGEMRELTIFPAKVGDGPSLTLVFPISAHGHTVEPIFEALSFCAALHPDPADEDAMDDDGDDAFISNEGDFDEQELSEAGRVRSQPSDKRFAPY